MRCSDAGCAAVFLPFWDSCGWEIGSAEDYADVVALCEARGKEEAVDCLNTNSSTTQGFPAATSSPPCCRKEWPLNASATQTSTKSPQVFSNDNLFVKIDGTVKLTWVGTENVEEVENFQSMKAVSNGIRSGNIAKGGVFSYTFEKAGIYYFRSEVHESLKATVNVMDCQNCSGTLASLATTAVVRTVLLPEP